MASICTALTTISVNKTPHKNRPTHKQTRLTDSWWLMIITKITTYSSLQSMISILVAQRKKKRTHSASCLLHTQHSYMYVPYTSASEHSVTSDPWPARHTLTQVTCDRTQPLATPSIFSHVSRLEVHTAHNTCTHTHIHTDTLTRHSHRGGKTPRELHSLIINWHKVI